MPKYFVSVLLGLFVVITACENRKAQVTVAPASVTGSSAVAEHALGANALTTSGLASKEEKAKVTRIVFVGKEHACDCTRKKVETAQAALQKLLGAEGLLPVEMLLADTEPEKVEPYRLMRPMMALPAIYFIDSKGALVELLQGEITEAQIAPLLKR